MSDNFVNQVFVGDVRRLLPTLPTNSLDAVLTDPMYGVAKEPGRGSTYDWGTDPCRGDPDQWWDYHRDIYHECLRVLRPGGRLALAMGVKFRDHFEGWFGGHRIWSMTRYNQRGLNVFGHIWIVQTREQMSVPFPDSNSLIICNTKPELLKKHPCPKSVEEMMFLVEHLSRRGDIVLDPFAGIGTTLVAAQRLGRRWVGCDLSRAYCRVALKRLR